ncbi:type III effector HopPmaJ(Pto) [Catenovulum agarivorans DS-2]|uniref:Type III effector HopPmaJ(Pto) n=1 Tax=Catenovulum agarivorans DS-2 TaxID=1328313 RepID=W7QGT6_9ALTE|nr:HopJ type III effector protein [Catenovulum agarivorans]EWH08147.1 type III effector HopPmaJ(Pto) [Catenovulum agarivorans DS-2]
MSSIQSLLSKVQATPESVSFAEVIQVVEENYHFTETEFKNGETVNLAGQNNGSCKIFAFAKLHNLSPQQALHLFGDYYRKDVLENPQGTDHQNIRNFIKFGWDGVVFSSEALKVKEA